MEVKNSNPPNKVLLAVIYSLCGCWAVFRCVRSMQILFGESHDLYTYYSIWFVFFHHACADIAFRNSLYLPHTWLLLTPVFIGGWPMARWVMFCINLFCIFRIWERLVLLAELKDYRKWLLLCFFCDWISPGIVLSLGNLSLVALALVLEGWPYVSKKGGLLLAASSTKQSLVFPVFLWLLIKHPRRALVPIVALTISGVATLIWVGMGPMEAIGVLRAWNNTAGVFNDATSLNHLLAFVLGSKSAGGVLGWMTWAVVFGAVVRYARNGLIVLSALLLISLLPMYHNFYDMVVAAPALAVLLKYCPLRWPMVMTLGLSGLEDTMMKILKQHGSAQISMAFKSGYYPCLILVLFIALLYLDRKIFEKQEGRAS